MSTPFARQLAIALTVALAIVSIPAAGPVAAAPPQPGFEVMRPVGADIGPSLAHANASDHRGETKREMTLLSTTGKGKPGGSGGGTTPDGALQTATTTALGATAGISFDGVGVGLGTYSPCCAPPDTNASVGKSQIVQWVNLDYAVWDKAGNLLTPGAIKGSQLFAGLTAGNCDKNNDGDPIVKYDAQADRWFVTQFSVTGGPPYYECIAVSSTSDFLNSTWARYAYSFGSYFPDYPKASVWPDAYYMAYNRFFNGSSFSGAAACAYDRAKMIAQDLTATGQCFNLSTSYGGLLPSDLDGAVPGLATSTGAPPAGAPNVFLNLGSGSLNSWKFHVDFVTPANSTFSSPVAITTAAFSKACNGGTCIAQAGTSNQLDSLADRLMYRLAYRNFGSYSSLVVTHSVSGSGTAAPRWYELRSTVAGGSDYTVYQQGSFAPTADYRWMSSAAQDKTGNIAIGYSVSSSALSPGIRYTGRQPLDTPGQLRAEQSVPLPSTGSQTGTLHRWGDYSSMAVDPVDDCTFWYTTEYLKSSGSFNWSTRLVSFKMPGCQ